MEVSYQKDQQRTSVIYGETVATMMRQEDLSNRQILICGNQRYYDLYADKLAQYIPDSSRQDWFITTNHRYCNDMGNFKEFVHFIKRFPKQEEILFIGIGNEGVIELTSFLHHVSNLNSRLWLIPVSIRSFAQSLSFDNQIFLLESMDPVLRVKENAEYILFDHTLADQQTTGKMVDLLSFIRCGIVCEHAFLQTLYTSFPNRQLLMQRSFSAFIESLIHYYQTEAGTISRFGKSFERAFFQTENGHLLSNSMKNMFGLLLELCWNIKASDLDFNFKNFMIWLMSLGYPLVLPEQISLGEYGQQVISLAKEIPMDQLNEIGVTGGQRVPTETELIETFKYYQQLLDEIRGN
ncbi:hypothetical protein NRIC_06850 [Enterococcus florum]|uniref:3-dehydroquinate synthase domain-containing protein n=1 Tax=Enterococcus florum TaxID=2480627 RepID=A0A4P5P919_9ENTE|nr:hypothetical protein [Enterococcus florum]GCF92794.1 hypothetical protein NRIC_06850 [Enterococcus florum]